MPQLLTRDFGPLDYEPEAELKFPLGLPGFEGEMRFVLIERDTLAPFVFLQSVTTPAVCFLTVPVQVVESGYQMGMTEEDYGLVLGQSGDEKTLFLAVLAANETGAFTANLLAPLVINLQTKIGIQAVRPDRLYSHQHPLPQVGLCS